MLFWKLDHSNIYIQCSLYFCGLGFLAEVYTCFELGLYDRCWKIITEWWIRQVAFLKSFGDVKVHTVGLWTVADISKSSLSGFSQTGNKNTVWPSIVLPRYMFQGNSHVYSLKNIHWSIHYRTVCGKGTLEAVR